MFCRPNLYFVKLLFLEMVNRIQASMPQLSTIGCYIILSGVIWAKTKAASQASAQSSPTIIGGHDALPGAWPWQAYITLATDPAYLKCGGTLINATHILTSAGCLQYDVGVYSIVLGAHNISDTTEPTQRHFFAKNKAIHEYYEGPKHGYDIALLELLTPVEFNTWIQPIHPCYSRPSNLSTVVTTGWGYTRLNEYGRPDNASEILQQVDLIAYDDSTCRTLFPIYPYFGTMCASSATNTSSGSCDGDIGGPLVHRQENGGYCLAGITSFPPDDCGTLPTYFTELATYKDWINGINVCPPPDKIFPCKCNLMTLEISCAKITQSWDIKSTFTEAAKFIPDDAIFNRLEIDDLGQEAEIPANSFPKFKFKSIRILSSRLEYISPQAFTGTMNYTTEFEISDSFNPHVNTIYEMLPKFTQLSVLRVYLDDITTVISTALDTRPTLKEVYLGSSIREIGPYAFANLPGLTYLSLWSNRFGNDQISPLAFESISSEAVVDIQNNMFLQHMEESVFKPLLDSAKEIRVSFEQSVGMRMDCDQRADWICTNEEAYKAKLFGFECKPATGFQDIWEYCASQVEKFNH